MRIRETAHGRAGYGFIFSVEEIAAAEGDAPAVLCITQARIEGDVTIGDDRIIIVGKTIADIACAAVDGEAVWEALDHKEACHPSGHVGGGIVRT